MITIAEAISDLLFIHETVVLPGLGTFVKKPVAAVVDTETDRFAPPSCTLEFDASLREENDLLARYLTENCGIGYEEATRMITSFVENCFNTFKTGKGYELDGVGTLTCNANGDFSFKQDGTANYNSDAFGLSAFTVSPVERAKTEGENKVAIEEEQRMENTPVTVDEEAVHEDEPDNRKRHAGWYWAALAACLLIGVFFGLRQFGLFDKGEVKPVDPVEQTQTPAVTQHVGSTGEQTFSRDSVEIVQQDAVPTVLTPSSVALTKEVPVSEYRVVAGCYDREENAVWFTGLLRGVGFSEAFYEKHGARWFVSFAHYSTYNEALEALKEIRNKNYQVWIQVPPEQ